MKKIGRTALYLLGFLLFMVAYGLASVAAHFGVEIVNADTQGWARKYVLPYFVAALSGGIAVAVALSLIERFLPTLRSRRIMWAFSG